MVNALWSYFFKPPIQNRALSELLRKLPVFDGLSVGELVQIERFLHPRRYQRGESVFNEGDPGAALYIVQTGAIEIVKDSSLADEHILATVSQGEFLGELALLDEMPRSARARAAQDSQLLAFSKPDLDQLVERNPRLGIKIVANVARLVCQRLVKANQNVEVLRQEQAISSGTGVNEPRDPV